MDDHQSMMHIHVFAAYFGLGMACCLSKPLPNKVEKDAQAEKFQMATSPTLFAMLGKDKVGGWSPAGAEPRGSENTPQKSLSITLFPEIFS